MKTFYTFVLYLNCTNMEVEGTKSAFVAMIEFRGVYKLLGVQRSTVAGWKIRLQNGEGISIDKMEEMLLKAGSTYKNERVWEIFPGKINLKTGMCDFHNQLKNSSLETEIVVDYSEGASETLVNNSLSQQAMKFGCLVFRDDSNRPVVKYRFSN